MTEKLECVKNIVTVMITSVEETQSLVVKEDNGRNVKRMDF